MCLLHGRLSNTGLNVFETKSSNRDGFARVGISDALNTGTDGFLIHYCPDKVDRHLLCPLNGHRWLVLSESTKVTQSLPKKFSHLL